MNNEPSNKPKCQKHCLKTMRDPAGEVLSPPLPFAFRMRLARRLNPRHKKFILRNLNRLANSHRVIAGRNKVLSHTTTHSTSSLKPGDLVRVRSKEEIEKTLDIWEQLKGCTFTEEMKPYSGTIQKVLKPVTRFLDERDQKLKKAKGIVLLEDVMCQGTLKFGPCDRSCFYYWRIEWLEKI